MAMTLTCPKCSTTHALTGRAPGEPFTCACGNVLEVPGTPVAAAPGGRSGRLARRVLLGVLALLVLGAAAATLALLPRLRLAQARGHAAEAKAQLYTLCTNVAALHDETGHWTAAGPAPKGVPRGDAVPFPTGPGFEKLQFEPGQVRYQFEVIVEGNPEGDARVRCVARGDLDGDGVLSEATLEIDANGFLRPLKWRDELE